MWNLLLVWSEKSRWHAAGCTREECVNLTRKKEMNVWTWIAFSINLWRARTFQLFRFLLKNTLLIPSCRSKISRNILMECTIKAGPRQVFQRGSSSLRWKRPCFRTHSDFSLLVMGVCLKGLSWRRYLKINHQFFSWCFSGLLFCFFLVVWWFFFIHFSSNSRFWT